MSADDASRRIVLVLGGVRSGKSRYAEEFASRGKRVAFLATAEACDDEMRDRIARHRAERPASWTTVEAPIALEEAVRQCGNQFDIIVVDCLTVWTANLMEHEASDAERVLAARRSPGAIAAQRLRLGNPGFQRSGQRHCA